MEETGSGHAMDAYAGCAVASGESQAQEAEYGQITYYCQILVMAPRDAYNNAAPGPQAYSTMYS